MDSTGKRLFGRHSYLQPHCVRASPETTVSVKPAPRWRSADWSCKDEKGSGVENSYRPRGTWQFLGISSYYRRFIQYFAHVASPLHWLTEEGRPMKLDAWVACYIWIINEKVGFCTCPGISRLQSHFYHRLWCKQQWSRYRPCCLKSLTLIGSGHCIRQLHND